MASIEEYVPRRQYDDLMAEKNELRAKLKTLTVTAGKAFQDFKNLKRDHENLLLERTALLERIRHLTQNNTDIIANNMEINDRLKDYQARIDVLTMMLSESKSREQSNELNQVKEIKKQALSESVTKKPTVSALMINDPKISKNQPPPLPVTAPPPPPAPPKLPAYSSKPTYPAPSLPLNPTSITNNAPQKNLPVKGANVKPISGYYAKLSQRQDIGRQNIQSDFRSTINSSAWGDISNLLENFENDLDTIIKIENNNIYKNDSESPDSLRTIHLPFEEQTQGKIASPAKTHDSREEIKKQTSRIDALFRDLEVELENMQHQQ